MNQRSKKPSDCEELLAMLAGRSSRYRTQAESYLKRFGSTGAKLLLKNACVTRFRERKRLVFLRLAREIGAEFDRDTAGWLQQLVDDKHQAIADQARGFLFEISPHGPFALIALPCYLMRPSEKRIREIMKACRSRRK